MNFQFFTSQSFVWKAMVIFSMLGYPMFEQSVRRQTGMAKIDFYYDEIEPFVTLGHVRLYGMKQGF